MARNARAISLSRTTPPVGRALVVAVAALFLAGVLGAYQVGVRSRRSPSFAVGGRFRSVDDLPFAGRDGRPFPYGDAPATPLPSTAPPATTVPSTPGAVARPVTPPTPTTAPPATAPALPSAPTLPAPGNYTYAVEGSESSTGFGSRAFPATIGVVIHVAPGLAPNELVHDLRMSAQHEERTIARYGLSGISLTYEGGSITFGPVTQTSAGSYAPPMVQLPWPLAEGASVSGATTVVDGSGKAERVERWTATVAGREQVTVLGSPHDTWVVDVHRATDPGGAEQVDRTRRYWFDPGLGTWVRWTERFHGSRNLLVDFTYDAQYTAQLTSFVPA